MPLRSARTKRERRLSKGTREQLAVAVRLAFGELLAGNGMPAPLVLDDALVYADDARLDRLFAALRQASQHFQVIVLSCRARAFAPLGGNRLAIGAWQP